MQFEEFCGSVNMQLRLELGGSGAHLNPDVIEGFARSTTKGVLGEIATMLQECQSLDDVRELTGHIKSFANA